LKRKAGTGLPAPWSEGRRNAFGAGQAWLTALHGAQGCLAPDEALCRWLL